MVATNNIKTDTTIQSSVMQPTTNNDSMANPTAGPIGKIRSFFFQMALLEIEYIAS